MKNTLLFRGVIIVCALAAVTTGFLVMSRLLPLQEAANALNQSSNTTATVPATATPATQTKALTIPPRATATPAPTATPLPATATPVPTATPAPPPQTEPTATPIPPEDPPPTSSSGMTAHELAIAQQLFQRVNQDRAAAGLPAYTWNDALVRAAHKHNLQMTVCGMSHQCPGEPSMGDRVSNEGVNWRTCGENVGWASERSDTWDGVRGINDSMMAETPPNDGHRRNLLSSSFTQIGIAVYIDNSNGKIWLTQDFSG